MGQIILYVIIGILSGFFSGFFGLGGGVIVIPALIYLFGLSQHAAQGTTLALMVPPIGLLAAWAYYKAGYVNLKMAAFICLGFFLGGLFGAKFAIGLPNRLLEKLFGLVLLLISLNLIFKK
jgi:uncharacterized membrane protein YfcA